MDAQMKTGRYRLRRGFRGKSILQYEVDTPSLIGGHVAADVRQRTWHDVEYDCLANIAVALIDTAVRKRDAA